MSSLELNKIAGAVLLAGLIALTTGILADRLVQPDTEHHAAIAVPEGAGETTGAPEPAAPEQPIAALLASADPAEGEKVAKRCASCHTFEKGGPNKVGPNLWNVVGDHQGEGRGFNFSPALSELGGTWTFEELDAFLTSPRDYAPGTKMTFAGLKKAEDRANLLAYLRSLSDSPVPLPEPPAETAAAQPAAAEGGAAEGGAAEDGTAGAAAAPAEGGEAAEGGGSPEPAATQQASAPADGGGIAALLASADPAKGEKIAKRCAACHTFDQGGPNRVGPNLWGIVGASTAHRDDYKYSDAIAGLESNWTYDALDQFLASPKDYAPGTKMTFAGLKKDQERADLIAWLRTLSENPPPLP